MTEAASKPLEASGPIDTGPALVAGPAERLAPAGAGDAHAAGSADAVRKMDPDVTSSAAPLDRIPSERWLFRLPMLGALSGQYEACVRMYDRDLLGYFKSTPRIDGEDRAACLDSVTRLVERMNAYQGMETLTWRIKAVLQWLTVWPAPWVFGLSGWVVAWSPAPWQIKLACTLAAAIYMVMSFAVVFCASENVGWDVSIPADLHTPRYSTILGFTLFASSVGTVAFDCCPPCTDRIGRTGWCTACGRDCGRVPHSRWPSEPC